jgi:hypothetical protein
MSAVIQDHRGITPPPGSAIAVATDGAVPVITVPQPAGGIMRYVIGAFLLFWLGGWVAGFVSASSQMLSGKAGIFLFFWLGAWTVGGALAAWTIYRILRPTVPETLQLAADGILYDSGIPPFRCDFNGWNRMQSFANYFPRRTIVAVNRQDLRSLRLRETESDNRLTVDVASARVDLARAASEVEREWLYRVLAERYALAGA